MVKHLSYKATMAVSCLALLAFLGMTAIQDRQAWNLYIFWILIILTAIAFYFSGRYSPSHTGNSREIFSNMLLAAPDPMVIIDESGEIILINHQFEKLFGYTAIQLIGQPVEILIPAELRTSHRSHREHFYHEPKTRTMGAGLELQAIKADGQRFPVEISLSPLTIKGKRYVAASIRDISGRKKAEQKFKGLLDSAPDATIIMNQLGLIEMVNIQSENIFGYNRTELVGKPVEMLIPEHVRQKHVHHRNHFLDHPRVREMGFGLELSAVRKNGTQFPVEISLSPINTEEGILVSASIRDITERKLIQASLQKLNEELESRVLERTEELEKSEKKFRALVENNDSIIAMINREGNIIYSSPSLIQKTGFSQAELKEIIFSQLIYPADLPELKKNIVAILRDPLLEINTSFRAVNKKGEVMWLEGLLQNRLNDEGLEAVITNLSEITARKNAELLTRNTRILLQSSLESSVNVNIFSVDRNYRYLYFNSLHRKTMLQMYKTDISVGESLFDFISIEKDIVNARPYIDKALAGNSLTEIGEFGDSARGYYESRYNPIYDDNAQIIGVSVFTFNITDRIVAEQALKKNEADLEKMVSERTRQLEDSHREMEAFTYSVSHDLRAPLRGIIGFTTILEEDYVTRLDDEAKRITKVIKENTRRMGQLIDDLLHFSKIGKSQMLKAPTDNNDIVSGILSTPEIKQLKINWQIHNLPVTMADAPMLRQVWINLISNAIKYSSYSSSPEIIISCYTTENEYVFLVRDNGVGFDKAYSSKLFKVFQRLHSTRQFEGSGVGLAIVEKIVGRHDGRVWADGEVDKGATFYFSIPK